MRSYKLRKYSSKISYLAIAVISITISFKPVVAAESIKFNYGIASQSISLEELAKFAQSGTTTPSLDFLLEFTDCNPELIRLLLKQEIPMDVVTLSRLLNSPIGEYILDRTSNVVNSGASQGNREALRGAFIKSANEDRKISLLEVWRNYPTKEVIVNGASWKKMTQGFSKVLKNTTKTSEIALTLLRNFLNSR